MKGPGIMRALVAALALACVPGLARAGIITHLPTTDRVVALTFDACESIAPARIDARITTILAGRRVPYTIFMGGRFARDNAGAVRALGRDPSVEIENHTWSHPKDMRTLSDGEIRAEIARAEAEILAVTGRRTRLFRFPGGNADARTVADVESMGYRVVHWGFPEGDPDPHVNAAGMIRETLRRTGPGEILIFHINGRGVHTAEALPQVIDGLKAKGFRFVRLSDVLDPPVA